MEDQTRETTNQTSSVHAHQTLAANSTVILEKHYSVPELAKNWGLSESTIRRILTEEPGVLRLAHEETRYKRRYTTLRVPERVARRIYRRLQGVV
jgi:predicted transcriptional regulator